MSERALRGTRLVVTSYETDRGIDLAPRQAVEYACEKGHRFEMPFSSTATALRKRRPSPRVHIGTC